MTEIPLIFHSIYEHGREFKVRRHDRKLEKTTELIQIFPSYEAADQYIRREEGRAA